jgi:hypothetical protein
LKVGVTVERCLVMNEVAVHDDVIFGPRPAVGESAG